MQLVRGIHNIKKDHHGCVLTIGNFDGIHLGHQAILNRLQECAVTHQLPSTVMIFEPHPEELFNPDGAPARISRLREKLNEFRRFNIERVVLIKFTRTLASMSAKDFVEDLLLNKLGVKHLIIGDDFRFGHQREGDYQLLQSLAVKHKFQLENTETVLSSDIRISSTAVRDALKKGDFDKTADLLGRSFTMTGRIFHGDKRGRTIGFPTANLLVHRCVNPLNGVYAVTLRLLKSTTERLINGIANIGNRPTVEGTREQLEVHLFEFNEDIYGQAVEVVFLHFIRGEQKFNGLDELTAQINKDTERAKQFFNDNPLTK